jgi:hypothetical protein
MESFFVPTLSGGLSAPAKLISLPRVQNTLREIHCFPISQLFAKIFYAPLKMTSCVLQLHGKMVLKKACVKSNVHHPLRQGNVP